MKKKSYLNLSLFLKFFLLNKEKHSNILTSHYYFNLISIPFTVIFYFLRIKPDNITYSRFLIGLLASILLYFNYNLTALFLYLTFIILDFCDGTLARFYKKKTFYGKFLDSNVDHLCHNIFFVSIGIFFYNLSQNIIDLIYSVTCIIIYIRGQNMHDLYSSLVRWSNLECNKKNQPQIIKRNFILLNFLYIVTFLQYVFIIIILSNEKHQSFLAFYFFFFCLFIFGLVISVVHFLSAYKNLKLKKI